LHLFLVLHDVALELHDLRLHVLLLEPLLHELPHEYFLLVIQGALVPRQPLHFFAFFFEEVGDDSVLFLCHRHLLLELLALGFHLHFRAELLAQGFRQLLYQVLVVLDGAAVFFESLGDQSLIVIDTQLLLCMLVGNLHHVPRFLIQLLDSLILLE
jgi:hypothetical protein